jgi:hypothetical protein
MRILRLRSQKQRFRFGEAEPNLVSIQGLIEIKICSKWENPAEASTKTLPDFNLSMLFRGVVLMRYFHRISSCPEAFR